MAIKSDKLKISSYNFHIFIILVSILKLILMGMFSSDYQNKMFMPFVGHFINNIMNGSYINTYEYYYLNHLIPSFPYPPFMLLIESIGGIGVNILSFLPLFFKNIIFKLPSLLFDFMGLYYLIKLYPNRRKYVAILYFGSPIILYSIYMHGQLDIIPTALLSGAIYYLVKKGSSNYKLFLIFLISALLTKFHIIAVLPIIFIYVYKKDGLKMAMLLALFTIMGVAIVIFPVMSQGFIKEVIFNNEQTVLTKVFVTFVNIKLYIPIISVMFIYLKEFNMTNINKELMIAFCGVLFAVFLAFVPPMPGWYVWIIPFITIFLISVNQSRYKSLMIYMLLNIFYILYFIFFHRTENIDLYFMTKDLTFIKQSNEVLGNIMFTLLTGILIFTIYIMYQLGVSSNSFYKRRNIPFTIGISGDSGSGKSTLIEIIKNSLGDKNLLFIEGDGDHKWERDQEMWQYYTHLNPKANYLYRQALDIETLRKGDYVHRVDYDHDTGKFSSEKKIRPRKFILLCGLHSFYLPQMRKLLDLKIYMDADESLRRYWKIQRDVMQRGYTKEKILEQIESRMPDACKYIYPQKEYADLIIQYFDKELLDCCVDKKNVIISLKLTLSAAINLEKIMIELSNYDIDVEYDYSEDLKKQTIIFDGASLENKVIKFDEIADTIITQVDEITTQKLSCENNINGIIQLVILVLISHKMQGDL